MALGSSSSSFHPSPPGPGLFNSKLLAYGSGSIIFIIPPITTWSGSLQFEASCLWLWVHHLHHSTHHHLVRVSSIRSFLPMALGPSSSSFHPSPPGPGLFNSRLLAYGSGFIIFIIPPITTWSGSLQFEASYLWLWVHHLHHSTHHHLVRVSSIRSFLLMALGPSSSSFHPSPPGPGLFNSRLLAYGSGFIIFIIPPITTWSGSLQFEASYLWLWVHHLHHSTHHHLIRVSSIRGFLPMALGSSSSSFHPSPPGPGLFNSKLLTYGSGSIIFIIPPITTWSGSLQFEASCLWLWVHHLHHSTHHHLVRASSIRSFLPMALGSSSSSFHPSPPGPGLFNSKLLAYDSGFIIFIIPPITTWSGSLQFEASCLWLWVHHLHHSTHHHLVRVSSIRSFLSMALGSSSSSFHPSPPGPGLFNSKLLAYGSGFIIFIIPPITTWSGSLQFEASCLWLWVPHLHHSTHHHLVRVDIGELGLALNQTHFQSQFRC